jgi:hypothetical protein
MAFKPSDVNEINEAGSKTVSNNLGIPVASGTGGKNWNSWAEATNHDQTSPRRPNANSSVS